MRPLIKALKGMLAVSFVGGCRLNGPVYDYDAGLSGPDGSADSSSDAKGDVSDAGSDAKEPDATDAAATD